MEEGEEVREGSGMKGKKRRSRGGRVSKRGEGQVTSMDCAKV